MIEYARLLQFPYLTRATTHTNQKETIMATIVTQTADNAYHIQDAFRQMNRDDYPLGVYEAIFDFINETTTESEYYHLDVIAWCCDLSETTLESENRPLLERKVDEDDLHTLDDLADRLRDETTVLYVDEDTETVYHLAY